MEACQLIISNTLSYMGNPKVNSCTRRGINKYRVILLLSFKL